MTDQVMPRGVELDRMLNDKAEFAKLIDSLTEQARIKDLAMLCHKLSIERAQHIEAIRTIAGMWSEKQTPAVSADTGAIERVAMEAISLAKGVLQAFTASRIVIDKP